MLRHVAHSIPSVQCHVPDLSLRPRVLLLLAAFSPHPLNLLVGAFTMYSCESRVIFCSHFGGRALLSGAKSVKMQVRGICDYGDSFGSVSESITLGFSFSFPFVYGILWHVSWLGVV